MKKFLLYCFVFLAGFLGMIGWAIACAAKVSGGVSTVLGCVQGMDMWILAALALVAVVGFLHALGEARGD